MTTTQRKSRQELQNLNYEKHKLEAQIQNAKNKYRDELVNDYVADFLSILEKDGKIEEWQFRSALQEFVTDIRNIYDK